MFSITICLEYKGTQGLDAVDFWRRLGLEPKANVRRYPSRPSLRLEVDEAFARAYFNDTRSTCRAVDVPIGMLMPGEVRQDDDVPHFDNLSDGRIKELFIAGLFLEARAEIARLEKELEEEAVETA